MSTVEKVRSYLKEHKRPVSVETIAFHFLISTSAIRKALYALQTSNEARCIHVKCLPGGRKGMWSYIHRPNSVAVSSTTHNHVRKPTVVSYANLRGYED